MACLPFENDVSPSAHDEPLLSDGTVHYLGQPLFLVVATSHLAARKAARMADIQIDARVPILIIDQALAANSRFEDGPRVWTKGDAEAALGKARTPWGNPCTPSAAKSVAWAVVSAEKRARAML